MRQKTFFALSVSFLLSSVLFAKEITVFNATNRVFTVYSDGWSLFNPFASAQRLGIGDQIVVDLEDRQKTIYFVQVFASPEEKFDYVEEFCTLVFEMALAFQSINAVFTKIQFGEQDLYYFKRLATGVLFGPRIFSFFGFNRITSLTLSAKASDPIVIVEPYDESFLTYVQEQEQGCR